MGNVSYKSDSFIIFPSHGGFVAYNTNKEFESGHTHLRSYYSAKKAIWYTRNKRIPDSCSAYFLKSLMRLSEDDKYIERLEQTLNLQISNKK